MHERLGKLNFPNFIYFINRNTKDTIRFKSSLPTSYLCMIFKAKFVCGYTCIYVKKPQDFKPPSGLVSRPEQPFNKVVSKLLSTSATTFTLRHLARDNTSLSMTTERIFAYKPTNIYKMSPAEVNTQYNTSSSIEDVLASFRSEQTSQRYPEEGCIKCYENLLHFVKWTQLGQMERKNYISFRFISKTAAIILNIYHVYIIWCVVPHSKRSNKKENCVSAIICDIKGLKLRRVR